MPEFSKNFAKGKMNKDVDERVIQPGEYRDALNIEVLSSEGSDQGAVQTLLGNIERTLNLVPDNSSCVGSIVNNEENCIYYLVSGGKDYYDNNKPELYSKSDYIIKYDIDQTLYTYVFVDTYLAKVSLDSALEDDTNTLSCSSTEFIFPGMRVSNSIVAHTLDANLGQNDSNAVTLETPLSGFNLGDTLTFQKKRLLNFNETATITGINIVDDLIMFTDGLSEPKIINIKRSILGTGDKSTSLNSVGFSNNPVNTRLVNRRRDGSFEDDGLEVVSNYKFTASPVYCKEENVTTVKRKPLTPPTLKMSSTTQSRNLRVDSTLITDAFLTAEGDPIATQSQLEITLSDPVAWLAGDFVVLTQDLDQDPLSFTDSDIRLRVVGGEGASWTVVVESISSGISSSSTFYALLQQEEAMFEFKFPRFGYRYKYIDGQYSAFSPFSEIAFLPGPYSYDPKEGYNLAMANRVRSLKVENYVPHPDNRPQDVSEIDILYKEEKSSVIYTVKTILPNDGTELWPADVNFENTSSRGSLNIESELIHAVVPANQLLRPWDNVPRSAKSQEVSANRVIYGNYVQNYDLRKGNSLVTPDLNVTYESKTYEQDNTPIGRALKSLKTSRTYQIGVVYADEHGRETPVLADKTKGSVIIPKEHCASHSSLTATIANNAPDWAKSFKFFIKETSNEYYNLAMDRWYNAEDGNLWISFPSSDRNKIDIDTFLELKKGHDTDAAVLEKARYKILAIENEAPQYIKIDRKSQGILSNDAGNTLIGTSAEGFPFADYNFITVEREEFESVFDESHVISKASECSLKIRNIQGERSEWYKITSISLGNFFGNPNSGYKIQVAETFGPDVNFASTNDSFASRTSNLQIQITRDEFVNKPEFDGRFFVKIFKDRIAEENLMLTDDENLVVVKGLDIRYLHTYSSDTGGTGATVNTANQTQSWSANTASEYFGLAAGGANIDHVHPFGYETDGSPYVFDADNYIKQQHGFNFHADDFLSFPKAICKVRTGMIANLIDENNAKDFWKKYVVKDLGGGGPVVFIDDAWAVSWKNSKQSHHNGFTEQNYEKFHSAPCYYSANYDSFLISKSEVCKWIEDGGTSALGHPTGGSIMSWFGNEGPNIGDEPGDPSDSVDWAQNGSRGIDNSGGNYLMDISSVGGLHGRDNEDDYDDDDYQDYGPEISKYFSDHTGQNDLMANTRDFFSLIKEEGVRWRWRQDPDRTVCTTTGFYEHRGIINAQKAGNFNNIILNDDSQYWADWNRRNKFTIKADKPIFDVRSLIAHDLSMKTTLEIMGPYSSEDSGFSSKNPAVFETYPKEDIGLDIYYEISRAYPISLSLENDETLAIIGAPIQYVADEEIVGEEGLITHTITGYEFTSNVNQVKILLSSELLDSNGVGVVSGQYVTIGDGWGGFIELLVEQNHVDGDSFIIVNGNIHNSKIKLPWFNCYSFGNGVESDRIRDDFNAPTIQNGVKASTTIAEQYKEERRKTGLIFSGIYNSKSGVNRFNQFIQAEPITKDLNPDNGSIQKLFSRQGDIVVFCEDKVLKVLSQKDALFNADGKSNVTATSKVLGSANPFSGDYGISTNPESFAADEYRCYFTDTQRGAVLRLSMDGITEISSYGMSDYFTDTFSNIPNIKLFGSFDPRKGNYNICITSLQRAGLAGYQEVITGINKNTFFSPITVSYSERAKGWVSFKSYVYESAVGVNNQYYTFKEGSMWQHHLNPVRNKFHGINPGVNEFSYVSVIFNDAASSVKNFQTIKYEGSQSKIDKFSTVSFEGVDYTDKEFYNLSNKKGWFVEYAETDLENGKVREFLNKEGKWFNYIAGECTTLENLDESDFTVQGIGIGALEHSDPNSVAPLPKRIFIKESGAFGWD